MKSPRREGTDHAGRALNHPTRVADLKSEWAAELILECPAELKSE